MRVGFLLVFALGLAAPAWAQPEYEAPGTYFTSPWDSLVAWIPVNAPASPRKHARRIVIIDPGHGGSDLGTRREADGQLVTEQQLTLWTALVLRDSLTANGDSVVFTVQVPDSLRFVRFGEVMIPDSGAKEFNLPGYPRITSDRIGLARRVRVAQGIIGRYPKQDIVWISIHYDWIRTPGRLPITGARIIVPPESRQAEYVAALARAFRRVGLLRRQSDEPIVVSGQRYQGIKHLFVLRRTRNPVHRRMFIELANVRSSDWLLIQRADTVGRYAHTIVAGLNRQ